MNHFLRRSSSDDASATPGRHVAEVLDTHPSAGAVERVAGGLDTHPSPGSGERLCRWCGEPIPTTSRRDAEFCAVTCRQSAFRLRRRRDGFEPSSTAGSRVFAYADPPYPGMAEKYYAGESSYAGEVDHEKLIAKLKAEWMSGELCGWGLSTSADALRDLLPLCPKGARICSWVKPIGVSAKTWGLHNTWEPLIVVGGRPTRGGVRDWLSAQPARRGGTLPGRKPLAFCAWLFSCLGMQPGDELRDLFPGTGIVSRAWKETSFVDGRRLTKNV